MWTRWIVITVITTLLAGCVVYAYNKGRQSGMRAVQTLWDSEKLATAQAQAEELMKARQRESALRALADKLRKERTDEAKRLAAAYAADLERLRDRPARDGAADLPDSAPNGSGPAAGCTGAQLFREDAGVLVGIARDADQLRLALKQCQAAYDAVSSEFALELPRESAGTR